VPKTTGAFFTVCLWMQKKNKSGKAGLLLQGYEYLFSRIGNVDMDALEEGVFDQDYGEIVVHR